MAIGISPDPLEVLIIGAGIAGLSAAIALGKQGHNVVILEKSRFARETGAAINLPPNCTALLDWMNIDPRNFEGTLLQEVQRYSYEGDLKYHRDFSEVRKSWQSDFYLVQRIDLHNYLKKEAQKTAILHTGCKIVGVNIENPHVVLDDGREFTGDLLLGADGAHSLLRREIAPNAAAPHPVGKACFRWLVPTQTLKKLESTRHIVERPGAFIEWSADDRRLVAYPCSNDTVLNLCGFLPAAEAGFQANDEGRGWQITGSKDALAGSFDAFDKCVRDLINLADEDLKIWQLYDMESLPTWHKGHAALIGDSAHPFQPYMGQGGAMAVEDAVSLATMLPPGTKPEDIPARLQLYETARRSRVEMVLEYTRMNGRDENDTSGAPRLTPTDMVKFMDICFVHNEIHHSSNILEQYQSAQVSLK